MNRGLLLDRDGVINVDRGYVVSQERFVFKLGVFPFLRAVQDRGYKLAIVTNQSGVARGLYTVQDYGSLTSWMLGALRQEGVVVDLVLACFEHKDGIVEPYNRQSFWRKPNPGMILEAAQRLRLDVCRSAMLGDKDSDMQAARAAGLGLCLLLSEEAETAMCPAGVKVVRDYSQALTALERGWES